MTPSLPDSDAPPASRIERLEALFSAAVNLPPDKREAFLSVQCPDDPDFRRELRRMLAADERAGAFLEIPLPEVLASDLPRASVARWKLLECVGEGGLGVVYRAECVEDGVRLEAAVKILRPGLDTGKFREKFVRSGRSSPASIIPASCASWTAAPIPMAVPSWSWSLFRVSR